MLFTYIFILCKGKDAAAYCDYIYKADLLRIVMFGERKLGKTIWTFYLKGTFFFVSWNNNRDVDRGLFVNNAVVDLNTFDYFWHLGIDFADNVFVINNDRFPTCQ